MININESTVKPIREIQALGAGSPSSPTDSHWKIGKTYFIRTVTHHLTGVLLSVTPQELVLNNACWIADDGRFNLAVKNGTFEEVEPFPADAEVIVGRGSLIDAVQIPTTPREVKP